MHRLSLPTSALLGLLAAGTLLGFQEARERITADGIRSHLLFLSSDRLAGRAPGEPGAAIAADYIAARLVAAGLEPLGGSYFQEVPVRVATLDPTTVSLAFESADARVPAAYPDDAVIWPGVDRPSVQLSGELVFVGFGIEAPRWGWNDFDGRDLTGKVLLVLAGEPPTPPDEPGLFDGRALTYFGRWTYKLAEARRRGASGALIVHRPEVGYDWDVVAASWTGERHVLDNDQPGLPLQGWVTRDFAGRALERAGLDMHELVVRAARRDFQPVATGITVRARIQSRSRSIRTRNVVGYLPGKDPSLRDENVIFIAHYDHLGIGPAVNGDSIYNGAYDNASGVSVLLELARAFHTGPDRPDRSVLFLATTEEEAGLLGARYYVANPLLPLESTVAAINIDGVNLWGETDDAVALGAELSTLGRTAAARAAELGMQLRTDPAPEKGAFFRSDHFPFARAGIPVLSVQHGLLFRGRPRTWGDSVMADWERTRYHRPADEFDPDTDLSGAVQQARWIFGIGFDLTHGSERPRWHDGSHIRGLPLDR
jgi:hypothetical protein